LHIRTLVEALADTLRVSVEAVALKYLDQKIAIRTQNAHGQSQRQLANKKRTGLIRLHNTHIGCHIGNYKVYTLTVHRLKNLREHFTQAKCDPSSVSPAAWSWRSKDSRHAASPSHWDRQVFFQPARAGLEASQAVTSPVRPGTSRLH